MILVVTLNPFIDKIYNVEGVKRNKSYNVKDFQYTPGGNGINVAKIIRGFNEEVMVLGFVGGETGVYIEKELDRMGIRHRFIPIKEETPSVIRILGKDGSYIEVIEEGPSISTDELIQFYELYKELIMDKDMVCASGDLPPGLPAEIYRDLIIMAKEYNKEFLLDTSGKALNLGIKALPYFIKPNQEEIEGYLGFSIESDQEIIQAGKYLSEDGIQIVVISLGERGSIVFHDGYIYRIRVPKVDVINSIGSGDSMVGGYIASLLRNYDFEFALRVAAACGTANAMETEPGKVDMNNMKRIMNDIVITKYRF